MILQSFRDSIADARRLRSLYTHCVDDLHLPGDYSDLLRMDIVYCMSALDKLIHDIVNSGMVDIYCGRKPTTQKYLSEPVTITHHINLKDATIPPPEVIFDGIVRLKLKHRSFLDPEKLADALGLVWAEQNKWDTIAAAMQSNKRAVVTELKNIFHRRNAIVHEADIDPVTNTKFAITTPDTIRIESFILNLGEEIHRLVT
ncbi:MAG: HEPN domain-containing protein [Aeromonas sp.]